MNNQISVKLYWENCCEDVDSLDNLCELIKRLESYTKDYQLIGTLCKGNECLSVGFGFTEVPMMYISQENNEILYSLGSEIKDEKVNEDIIFFYQGSWSRFGKRTVVPYNLAVEAFKEFYLTGNRTSKVKWQYSRYVT